MEGKKDRKGDIAGRCLVDLVFSWSLSDVLSKNLYKYKVSKIPDTFSSASQYLISFVNPLIEEIHADLASSMTTLAGAPACEILSVKMSRQYEPPQDLFYAISLKRVRDKANEAGTYEPQNGDLIALTHKKPKTIKDLDKSSTSYVIALVNGSLNEYSNTLPIFSSKPLDCFVQGLQMRRGSPNTVEGSLFAVSLINMTTSIRIWQALHRGISGKGSLKLIQTVLQPDSAAGNTCTPCNSNSASVSDPVIRSFNLNNSQQTAVASCIALRECDHQNSVKLIWGPPGTGKTKTVATLLFRLFQLKCRTITCAPTNTAVVEVTTRLLRIVRESTECGSYGLGDVILFGNEKRMKMDEHGDLLDVFLDSRIKILAGCFAPRSGWKHSVEAMISLLEDPEKMYHKFLEEGGEKDEEEEETILGDEKLETNRKREGKIHPQHLKGVKNKKNSRNVIDQILKKNKKKQQGSASSQYKDRMKHDKGEKKDKLAQSEDHGLLTFEEFVTKRFVSTGDRLKLCIVNLYTHLPTSLISIEDAKSMIKAVALIESIATLLCKGISFKRSKENIHGFEDGEDFDKFSKLLEKREDCLQTLRRLHQRLQIPKKFSYHKIKLFCLCNARLIFCTASGSAKLHKAGKKKPFELLVIDEAAQLKECESAIPLQLTGLRHAILVGDEMQLPAMVKSKISARAEFGRSLFERLVKLGEKKHLLNLQYRMHPSISLFPNQEFYKKKIQDAPNVRKISYERCFLEGDMYGSYSFINLAYGAEEKGNNNSTRNMAEVAAVSEIIARLYRESIASKRKVSVGVISPYNAQVFSIQEKLGKTYTTSTRGNFSVHVRSVDGFQGGEEDVIIISTVRNNLKGEVGFLSSLQRTNVALTRARHCLWIVGNGATLEKSGSVWKRLVSNAKARGCFHDAEDDKNLAAGIAVSLAEDGHFHLLQDMESILFRGARWEICFNRGFWKSLSKIKSKKISKAVFQLLEKLSTEWRCSNNKKNPIAIAETCSELLQQYRVNRQLNLVCTKDILKENSNCTQVLKVWDILSQAKMPKLARRIEISLRDYTVNDLNRCKFKCREGDLDIPMTWPGNM